MQPLGFWVNTAHTALSAVAEVPGVSGAGQHAGRLLNGLLMHQCQQGGSGRGLTLLMQRCGGGGGLCPCGGGSGGSSHNQGGFCPYGTGSGGAHVARVGGVRGSSGGGSHSSDCGGLLLLVMFGGCTWY